jgi:MFS family permease
MIAFGGLGAFLVSPYLADYMGRKYGTGTFDSPLSSRRPGWLIYLLAVGLVLVVVGSILTTFPPSSNPKPMYLGSRFLLGFGITIATTISPLLIAEIAHPRHRAQLTTLLAVTWYVGAIVAAWTTYATIIQYDGNVQWRIPSGIQASESSERHVGKSALLVMFHGGHEVHKVAFRRNLNVSRCISPRHLRASLDGQCADSRFRTILVMPGFALIGVLFMPESPRYYISRKQPEKARTMLIKYHGNGLETRHVQWEFDEISETMQLERELASGSGWLEFIRSAANRKRAILVIATAIFSQCSGNSIVSYYLSIILENIGVINPTHKALINCGLTIWSFLIATSAAFLVDKVGRRVLFLSASIGTFVTFSIWTACSAEYIRTGRQIYGNVVLAMIFLFYGVIGLAYPGLLSTYTTEILPYKLRAKGLTLSWLILSLCNIFNQYVNPIGLEKAGWKFYFLYLGIIAIEIPLIYFYYPETKGLPLEEVARVFEGNDAAVAVVLEKHQQGGQPMPA